MNNYFSKAKKSLVLQRDKTDCGVACLSSICKFHGGRADVESLRRLSGTSTEGTTLFGLQIAAQSVGFEAEGLEADSIQNLQELSEPAILHVTLESNLQHYLVYYPQNKRQVDTKIIIGDPAHAVVRIEKEDLEKIWKSKALLRLSPTNKFVKNESAIREERKWLVSLLKNDLNILTVSILLGIIISALGISTAIFSQKLMDEILPRAENQRMFFGLVLILLLLVARNGFSFLRGYILLLQGKDFNNNLISNFYRSLLYLPKSFFDTRKIGELIARMNDTRRIQSFVSLFVGSISIDILIVCVSIAFVFIHSTEIGNLILLCLPIYFLILQTFGSAITQAQKKVMVGYASTESYFIDSIQGITDIKLANKQDCFAKSNSETYNKFQESIADLGVINLKFVWFIELVGSLLVVSVFAMTSWLVVLSKLSIGQLVSLIGIVGSVIPALNRIVAANLQLSEAKVTLTRMFEFTSMDKEPLNPGGPQIPSIKMLKVESISFGFPGRKQILKNVSIGLECGKIVALLGESGKGKSTLIQLIQRFYEPDEGIITVDGKNINEIQLLSWRSQLGSVPQEPKIFNGTLAYNISFSANLDEQQRVIHFCQEVGFNFYFSEFPNQYTTIIGEEGINISGGQKQLVILARALFSKPKILLLDEATSSLDKATEKFVLGVLQEQKKHMAILLVTHDENISLQCDKVFRI